MSRFASREEYLEWKEGRAGAPPPIGPPATAPPGGLGGATGYRYWTISVSNLDELVGACGDGGYKVAVPPTEIRPGIKIAMVEDPDGNWVEFLETSG